MRAGSRNRRRRKRRSVKAEEWQKVWTPKERTERGGGKKIRAEEDALRSQGQPQGQLSE